MNAQVTVTCVSVKPIVFLNWKLQIRSQATEQVSQIIGTMAKSVTTLEKAVEVFVLGSTALQPKNMDTVLIDSTIVSLRV